MTDEPDLHVTLRVDDDVEGQEQPPAPPRQVGPSDSSATSAAHQGPRVRPDPGSTPVGEQPLDSDDDDPEGWQGPGRFPGDPNTYTDPDNPPHAF